MKKIVKLKIISLQFQSDLVCYCSFFPQYDKVIVFVTTIKTSFYQLAKTKKQSRIVLLVM